MTPEKQLAESVKYICTQFCAVPQPDGRLSVFVSYGAQRTYTGEFTPAEFADHIRADYTKQKELHDRRQAAAETARATEELRQQSLSAIEIDFTI